MSGHVSPLVSTFVIARGTKEDSVQVIISLRDVEPYSSVSLNQGSEIQLCFLDVQILAFFFLRFFNDDKSVFKTLNMKICKIV